MRKPIIYLAAMYSLKDEIADRKAELVSLGYTVSSTWTEEPQAPQTSLKEVDDEVLATYATRDIEEINAADAIVLFTVDPDALTRRGGRHTEFGYALARGLQTLIVGPRENIFHHLKGVIRLASWEQFIEELMSGEFDISTDAKCAP